MATSAGGSGGSVIPPPALNRNYADMKGAIAPFDGADNDAATWYTNFETIFASWRVDEARQYYCCRRPMKGTAALGLNSENVSTYAPLERLMLSEFDQPMSMGRNISQLQRTCLDKGEPLIPFAYRMRGIALRGGVEKKRKNLTAQRFFGKLIKVNQKKTNVNIESKYLLYRS